MARILFVAKDNGCASVTEQVAVLAREDGHKVICAIEGLAMKRYEALGFVDKSPPNHWGCVDFRAPTGEERKRGADVFGAVEYLEKVKPDIVVTGLGSPINIQRDIAEEATRFRIPLVVCEDFWAKSVGHLSHNKVNPEMILTVDEYSVLLVDKAFPKAYKIVVGNPGVKKVQVPENVQVGMEILHRKFGRVFVYAGAGPESTTAELNLLLRCLEKTGGNWCLVPRFHPKYEKLQLPGMEKPYGEIWREYLAPFSARVRYVEASSTDPVAVAGDVVLSGFSTLLSTALWNKVPAVCLKTPETVAALKAHGEHYTEIPQVALGLVPAVTEPTDLSQFGLPSEDALQKLVPYDAALAYKHIRELL